MTYLLNLKFKVALIHNYIIPIHLDIKIKHIKLNI